MSTFGDFLLLISTIPVHFLLGYYRQWSPPTRDPFQEGAPQHRVIVEGAATERTHRMVDNGFSRPPDDVPFEVEHKTRSRTARNDMTRGATFSRAQSRPTVARAKSSGIPQPTRSSTRQQNLPPESAPPPYEIWYPPAASYDASAVDPLSGLPTPPVDTPPPFEKIPSQPETETTDEWRQYPAFPSAYPATPLPVPPRLPLMNGAMAAPVPVRLSGGTPFADILEEPMHSQIPPGLSDNADATAEQEHQQDFYGSLPSQREFQDPDSAADSSDDHDNSDGIQHEQHQDDDMDVENDYTDDDDDEEDDFDVTLRTPFPKIRVHEASKEKGQLTSTSTESLASRSTALSTTDNGSELRTRTNSVASTTYPKSDASSVVGRKRRLPRGEYNDLTVPSRIRTKPSAKTLSTRPTAVQLQARMKAAARERSRAHKDSSASADEDTADTDSDASGGASSDLKRRRVPGVPGDRLPRPAATRGDSNRTIRAAARKPTVNTSDSRPSSRRPPSRVGEREREGATVRSRRPVTTMEARTRSASRK